MSMRYPGRREFNDGVYVRTPTGKVGKVTGSRLEHEPSHDCYHWEDGDEYMQHVYVVEFVALCGEVEEWPWPEELLEFSSPMDALVQH